MCYDIQYATIRALKIALRRGGSEEEMAEIERQLEQLYLEIGPQYHVSGFAHPDVIVFTNRYPKRPQLYQWGLIPSWVKDVNGAKTIMKQTLNARAETLFEKPSFKSSAIGKRCLIFADAFYEHHDFNGKKYPFRIAMKDGSPMVFAGIWNEWMNPLTGELVKTVSIVTTVANSVMAKIHNSPKLELGLRMPVILSEEKQEEWLSDNDPSHLQSLLVPLSSEELEFHPVRKLKGKDAVGNTPDATKVVTYTELKWMEEGK